MRLNGRVLEGALDLFPNAQMAVAALLAPLAVGLTVADAKVEAVLLLV